MHLDTGNVAAQDGAAETATVLSYLRAKREPLFALIDAARKPANVILLRESGNRHESLYSGNAAAELQNVAPYLVELTKGSAVLDWFATEGWWDAWGYCIVSGCSLEELRTHLRKFLMVTLHDRRQVYFRFYDPRVLRVFLLTSTLSQAAKFFEKIDCILCPGSTPSTITSFRLSAGGVDAAELAFHGENSVHV